MAEKETSEEDLMDALARFDLDVEDTVDLETLKVALTEQLGYIPTQKQLDAFGGAQFEITAKLEELGIRALTIEYQWGQQVRYAWKGHPGLWGWERISEEL